MMTDKKISIDVPKNSSLSDYLKSKVSSKNKTDDKNEINIISEEHNNIVKKNDNKASSIINESDRINEVFLDLKTLDKFLLEHCQDFYNKFELLELIKSGSAGAVYKGQVRPKNNKQNVKQIVFKFLFDNIKEKREIKEKKEKKKNEKNNYNHQEIQIHGVLKCKHIPEIYGYYRIHNSSCIAMEFNKYGDIESFKKKILKRSTLSETLVLYIAGGIIEALHYIHSKYKIIHMDIKQQNILIDDFLMVKLTDFSVSINYRSAKNYISLPMAGTCYYMSPEVLGKKKILVSEASKIDVYSLGVLLYLLAFCDYPYKLNDVSTKNYAQIEKNVKEKDLEFPKESGHSKVFLNFLSNCLNKDIKKRYDIYQVMNDPWFKGYQIILNEKEKLYNAGKLVIDLMVDNFVTFNEYIKKQESLI